MAIKTPAKYREMEFRSLIYEMVCLLTPKIYVEIGVKKAWTFNAIAPMVRTAYGIDIDPNCAIYMGFDCRPDFIEPNSFTAIDNYGFYCGDSQGFIDYALKSKITAAEEEFIDFLFIDGDHEKEAVLKDFYTLLPYVKTHTGVVFMHDTYPIMEGLISKNYCFNAWEAVKEIRENFDYVEVFTIPGPWAGLSMIRKLGDATGHCHGWMDSFKIDKE